MHVVEDIVSFPEPVKVAGWLITMQLLPSKEMVPELATVALDGEIEIVCSEFAGIGRHIDGSIESCVLAFDRPRAASAQRTTLDRSLQGDRGTVRSLNDATGVDDRAGRVDVEDTPVRGFQSGGIGNRGSTDEEGVSFAIGGDSPFVCNDQIGDGSAAVNQLLVGDGIATSE